MIRTKEAGLMRLFMGIPDGDLVTNSTITNTAVDGTSCIFGSTIGSERYISSSSFFIPFLMNICGYLATSASTGRIQNCVLNNVRCKHIDAVNSILINVTAESIVARGQNIVYNFIDESAIPPLLNMEEKAVLVGVFSDKGEQCVIRSDMDTDGGK